MYEDILGPRSIDELRKIRNRKFNLEPEEESEDEYGIFEEIAVEFDYE